MTKTGNVNKLKAFTLIELLIVVAIIAILAAIAVPNFLEAQVRAKVSRAKADMRSLATALESYHVDNNGYPLSVVDSPMAPTFLPANIIFTQVALLTTPIAYITVYPEDAFKGDARALINPALDPLGLQRLYDYRRARFEDLTSGQGTIQQSATGFSGTGVGEAFPAWLLYSPGPDQEQNINTKQAQGMAVAGFGDPLAEWPYYDPTNGTLSVGDVIRSPFGDNDDLSNR